MGCNQSKATNVAQPQKKPTAQPSKKPTAAPPAPKVNSESQNNRKDGWLHSSGIQPEPIYVFKTTFDFADGKQEKVFVNIFHHKKVPSEHCLVQDRRNVPDKKGETCYAYGIVIADDLRDKCLEEKYREWVSERVVELLNQLFKDARLDGKGVKLPIIKKGFVGESIPYFSMENELVSWKSLSFTKQAVDAKIENASTAPSANPVASPSATVTSPVISETSNASPAVSNTHVDTKSDSKPVAAAATPSPPTPVPAPVAQTSNAPSAAAGTTTNTTTATTATTSTTTKATTATSAATATATVSAAPSSEASPTTSAKTDENQVVAEIAEIPVPRRLTGWMKKQGHVARNWKTRFFVLDHGFLTYYVDQQEKPPFGVDKKGQVCLAGYRDKSIMKRPDSTVFLAPGYDRNARRDVAVASAASAAQEAQKTVVQAAHEDDNEYDENDDNACLIQLEFYSQIIDANALDELKRRNGDASFKHDVHREFLLICRTQQERDGWLAALEAHTSYIENVALKYIQERDAAIAAAGESSPPSPPSLAESGRRFSFTTSGRRSSTVPDQTRNVSRASRRASMALSAQKWSVFLNKNEKVVLMGIVEKPNPVGYKYLRELLLVQREDVGDEKADSSGIVCRKRLIYIDSNSYEKKGEVLWLDSKGRYPSVTVVGDRIEIMDINNKPYVFYPKDDLTPEKWVEEINAVPPV